MQGPSGRYLTIKTNHVQLFLEILKFTIPAFIVFLTAYLMLRQILKNQYLMNRIDLKRDQQQVTLPLRLQAYERLTLFCERSSLENVVLRVRSEGMTATQLQYSILIALQKEYEHNVAQQVYVSPTLWEIILLAKNTTIGLVNQVGKELPRDADGNAFSSALFEALSGLQGKPFDQALLAIKKEAGELM